MVKALASKPRIWTTMIVVALLMYLPVANSQTRRASNTTRTTPQTTPAGDAQFDQLVKQADEAREAERLDDAIRLYGQALKTRPKWPDGWWYIGAMLYEKDSYAEAKDAFQNVVALEPKRAMAWGMLGLCQFQTKDYEQSVRSMQRARLLGMTENREIESVVRYHTGLLYIRFEQFEIAFTILSEFVRVG